MDWLTAIIILSVVGMSLFAVIAVVNAFTGGELKGKLTVKAESLTGEILQKNDESDPSNNKNI